MIFLIILKWIGIVLLGLLLLILLLSLVPIHANIRYDHELTAHLRILFFKKKLYPQEETENEDKEKKKKKEEKDVDEHADESDTDEEKSKPSVGETFQLVEENLRLLLGAVKFLCKGVHIRHMEILWRVSGENAAEVATKYGKIQAGMGVILGLLLEIFTVKKYRIHIEPDFQEQGNLIRAKADISFRLVTILLLLPKLFKIFTNYKKWKKNLEKSENSSSETGKVTEKL